MDAEYTNRELDEKFDGLHEKLDLILAQTTKTNGRVNRLEIWRGFISGGLAIVTIVILPIIFLLIK